MRPDAARRSPAMQRRIVDLPLPDGPTSASVSPGAHDSVLFSRMWQFPAVEFAKNPAAALADHLRSKLSIDPPALTELAHAKLSLLEVDSKLRTGVDLHDEIVGTAKLISADLLVLSTHGYTGWKHLLFGSDAEKILEHAPCHILVVR